MKGMENLYDSEKTRLQLGNLEEPPHLILNKEEYNWYLNTVTDSFLNRRLKDKVLSKEIPLLFRGIEVLLNEDIK